MMFKHRRRANIAMPAILLCQCSWPVESQKCTYENMFVNCFDLCMSSYFTYIERCRMENDVIRQYL